MFRYISALTMAILGSANAHAALIDLHFMIQASDFSGFTAAESSPYGAVSGTFSLTFDNSASISATKTGLSISDFTLPSSVYDLKYKYTAENDVLWIGTDLPATGCVTYTPARPTSCFAIIHTSTPQIALDFFSYSTPVNEYDAGTFSLSPASNAVPEPTTWFMAVASIGGVGASMRRRRQAARAILA